MFDWWRNRKKYKEFVAEQTMEAVRVEETARREKAEAQMERYTKDMLSRWCPHTEARCRRDCNHYVYAIVAPSRGYSIGPTWEIVDDKHLTFTAKEPRCRLWR